MKERATLTSLDEDSDELELLRLLLDLSLPRSIRPSTILPLEIELKVAGLDIPKDWYLELIEGRERVKLQVLKDWLDEKSAIEVLRRADELAAEVRMGQSPAAGSDLDEGDLGSLMSVCSEVSWNLAEFMKSIKKRRLARRFETLSRQLRYGLREDLAGTDLPELWIEQFDLSPSRQLTRIEMRTLFENGYASIEDVVRKDIDPAKESLARNRFAKNCGLDGNLAKQVYKSALAHVRMRLSADR